MLTCWHLIHHISHRLDTQPRGMEYTGRVRVNGDEPLNVDCHPLSLWLGHSLLLERSLDYMAH